MTVVSQKIPSLVGGVSRQSDSAMLPNQVRECINFLPDVTLGLVKRPGLRAVQAIDASTANSTWFSLFKSESEKYVVQVLRDGNIRIFDADSGVRQTVNAISGPAQAYAAHTDTSQISVLQINDFTFLINRGVVTAASSSKSAVRNPYGYLMVNIVGYETEYRVTLNSTTFTYTSPASGTLSVRTVTSGIVSLINANANWTASAVGNAIRVRRVDNNNFQISAEGGSTGDAIEAYKDSVPTVAQLPREFFNNEVIQVKTAEVNVPGYWLKFSTTNSASSGAGVWEETIKPDEFLGLDPATLPHVIVKEANGTFTYRAFDSAGAAATAASSNVTGVVTAVSPLSTPKGRYFTGQTFPVYGGSGINLKLRVTRTRTDVTVSTPVVGPSRVEWVTFADGKNEFRWFEDSTTVRITNTADSFTLNDFKYEVNSSFASTTPVPGSIVTQVASIKITETRSGVVDLVEAVPGSREYTNGDVVSALNGDTFTVNTVSTITFNVAPWAKQSWTNRTVGDTTSNPNPSFTGSPLSGIAFFQNRLVLMSGENVVCSKAGDYFNFFADSAATILDSDPVDLSAGSTRPIQLRHSVLDNRGLLLFGDNAQYVLETRTEAFSPATAELNAISAYNLSPRIPPVDSGVSIFFIEESDAATSAFEMATGGQTRDTDIPPVEITQLVPSYIPADISRMVSSPTISLMGMSTNRDPNSVFLFRYTGNGERRNLSSWFKWRFPAEVIWFDFYHEDMMIILRTPTHFVLCKCRVAADTPSGDVIFDGRGRDLHLDIIDPLPVVLSYDANSRETTVEVKDQYYLPGTKVMAVSTSRRNPGRSHLLGIQGTPGNYFIVIPSDFSNEDFVLGYELAATALLPSLYFRQGESASADTINVPTIHRIFIDARESGPFTVNVAARGRPSFSKVLPTISSQRYLLNEVPMLRTFTGVVPIMAKGDRVDIELQCKSPFQSSFTSMSWEGTYNNKGIRLT